MIYLRIIEKILIIYFTVYFVVDLLMYLYSLYVFFFKHKADNTGLDYGKSPRFSIVVARAYNRKKSF